MFNLFKKTETAIPESELVKQIHDEFDAAEGLLLSQAESVLKELQIPTETEVEKKAKRLSALGFKKSEVVGRAESLVEERNRIEGVLVSTKEKADVIKYYQQEYPFLKFITEDLLEKICQKYNLVFAPVGSYIKDVPEKNITEIESTTPLKQGDKIKDCFWVKVTKFWHDTPKSVEKVFKESVEYVGRFDTDGNPYDDDLIQMVRDAGVEDPIGNIIFNRDCH